MPRQPKLGPTLNLSMCATTASRVTRGRTVRVRSGVGVGAVGVVIARVLPKARRSERMLAAARRHAMAGPAELVERLYEEVRLHEGERAQHDDITILAARVL